MVIPLIHHKKTAIQQNIKWLADILLFTAFSAGVLKG